MIHNIIILYKLFFFFIVKSNQIKKKKKKIKNVTTLLILKSYCYIYFFKYKLLKHYNKIITHFYDIYICKKFYIICIK